MAIQSRSRVQSGNRAGSALATRQAKKPWAAIALFIGPVMLFYAIFILYPLLATFYYSVHSIQPVAGELRTTFVGLENFRALLHDEIFHLSIKNTVIWAVVGPILEILTALVLAFVVFFRAPFHRFYRVAWFLPILVSGVIVGLVFRWVFNYDWGLLNTGLRAIGLDMLAVNWLGRRDTPLGVVIFVHYWSTFGYSFVLLLAGLSAVQEDVIDATKVDGANLWQTITRVMIPIIWPTIITVLILSFLGKMRAFNVVWVLTNGGPMHFSETVATYVQKRAFGWSSLDLGYPSAISVAWFGIVLLSVSLINRRFVNRS